ncbi:MAG: PASTA domain-containing protein [Bacteroidales bacterium]|nr:PASTA domain-containing protein [Bacteroidales bacterium]
MARTSKDKGAGGWILRNLIWAIILILALVVLLQFLLDAVTRHNKEIDVPDFSGLTIAEAADLARANNVRIDLTDSVYVSHLPLGTVFSQNPKAADKVKKGRRILITINATQPKTVAMPRLVGLSLRGAKTEILACGLTVGTLTYVPDMATNYVLAQKVAGRNILPGKKVKIDTPVDLTLGVNSGESYTYIPYLIGHTAAMAREILVDNSLNVGEVKYDSTVKTYADSLQAQVFSQSPAYSGVPYPLGTQVTITLTNEAAKVSKTVPVIDTLIIPDAASPDSISDGH